MGSEYSGIPALLEMLTYKRPAWSSAEREFIGRFVAPTGAVPDAFGNYVLQIGDDPEILWSAHTDTVHSKGGRQRLYIHRDVVHVAGKPKDCLGADDTTGVWLLLELIRAGKPGLYIFHRAEEIGCQGSNHIRRHTPALLEGIKYAIAFDRKGRNSIVTHQMGRRTASDEFAESLSSGLRLPNLRPDTGGVYTDTEVYSDLVAECTNVSVGYESAHTPYEDQDLSYAKILRDAIVQLDTDTLVEGDWEWVDYDDDEDSGETWWDSLHMAPSGLTVEAVERCYICDNDIGYAKPFRIDGVNLCADCFDKF